mgnify:FL=1
MRAPREHGALFSAPMVRAVLAEVEPKTQTRRILTRSNSVLDYDGGPLKKWPGLDFEGRIRSDYPRAFSADAPPMHGPTGVVSLCVFASDLPGYKPGERTVHRIYPRVRPGDRLWGRETYGYRGTSSHWDSGVRRPFDEVFVEYICDGAKRTIQRPPDDCPGLPQQRDRREGESYEDWNDYLDRWWKRSTPAIFMPRWASRITLEVTDVRVERVQSISDADIRAEGVTVEAVRELLGNNIADTTPSALWRMGWCAINGQDSWDRNDWVWAYTFRRVA